MKSLLLLFLSPGLLLASCGHSEAELQATTTEIAAHIFASLTAQVPTSTPTPIPTHTPSPSPTPAFDAVVNVTPLKAFSEPAISNLAFYEFSQDDGLIVTGRNRDCSWLEVLTPLGDRFWVSTSLERVTLLSPCESLPHGYARPENAAFIFDNRQAFGRGELKIENGLSQDGYMLLLDSEGVPVLGCYIRANSEAVVKGIPDSKYQVYFSVGEAWDLVDYRFAQNARYGKFQDLFKFASTRTNYTILAITLHAVEGGTAETETLQPDEFPTIEP